MTKNMKNMDILDFTKIILSLMVVAIHSNLFPMILYPWVRLAVPLFFIISSYLLHLKINNSNEHERKMIIKHYIIRMLKLYMFWLIALLPITIYFRKDWFNNGIFSGLGYFILKFFLGSTFKASWYISASIIGTIIVDILSKKNNIKILLLFYILVYLLCCYCSGYVFFFSKSIVMNFFHNIHMNPECSFPVSLIYIYLGSLLSEDRFKINRKINAFLIVISCILLYTEWLLIYKVSGGYNKDSYIFIMPTSFLIFNYIKNIKITINNSKTLRQLSNFIYPLHASVASFNRFFLRKFISNDLLIGMFCFLITLLVCLLGYIIVKHCENKIKILKYSY